LSRGKGISVCCALSVETVLWRSGARYTNTVITHKQTNEFAAHEELRAAAARSRYPAAFPLVQ
jgi:hypothetical protein